MKASRGWGFRLCDAIILVAATTVGCSLVHSDLLQGKTTQSTFSHNIYDYEGDFALVAYPIWLSWTYAALVIRLRPPRPPFRRLARQPGMIACLMVSLCVPFWFGLALFDIYCTHDRPDMVINHFFWVLPQRLAFLIFGAWLVQWLNGRWRPEPSSIDRFGRLVGFGWIAFYLLQTTCYILHEFGLGRLF